MLTRRDFISCQFRAEDPEVCSDMENELKEEACLEQVQAISSDFTDEMLFGEMMRIGKDPSNMSREQMLHEVLEKMRIK